MKKSISLALFPTIALAIFLGVNAFVPRASGENNEKYYCEYGYNEYLDKEGYNCIGDGNGESYCLMDEETGLWTCGKDGSRSSIYCENYVTEGEEEGLIGDIYIYCMPEYSCVLEGGESIEEGENSDEGTYHCEIKENGGFECSDGEGGPYCWNNNEGYLNNCEHEGDDYYCYKGYSITDDTDSLYHFELTWEGVYNCRYAELLESVGGLRGSPKGPSYTPGYAICTDYRENENYRYCKDDGQGGYFCPKMYSYDLNIDAGVYDFFPDMYGDYYCESDSEGEGGGMEVAKNGGDGNNYTCYYLENESLYHNNCEEKPSTPIKSDGEGYLCPITYSCELDDDGYFCEENMYGDYYCAVNYDDEQEDKGMRGASQTYSCFSGLNNLLSDSCSAIIADGRSVDFGGFSCPFEVETYTITISTNDNGYGAVNPIGELDNIPYGTAILIDENNTLTIGGNEVIATPAQSTPEYTYIFSRWTNTCGDTLIQDCTITANFSRIANEYTITFVDGNKTYVYTGTIGSTVAAPNWSKEGYTVHWDREIPTTMPAENLTINASWIINQYTITFDLNGGSGTIDPVTQNYNSEVSEPTEQPTREGYTFAGWYDGNSKVTFPYRIPASNKTLTAHWNGDSSGGNGGYSGGGGRSGGSRSDNRKEDNKSKEDKPVVNPQSIGDNDKLDEEQIQKEDNKPEGGDNNGRINTSLDEEQKYSQEALDAYHWAYANGLTKYSNIKDARLDEYMNRSEMAKISTIFATKFRGEIPDENKREFCSKFSDLWKVEEDTKEYIIQSCELGNMGYQANGVDELQKFRPYTPVSLAETSIILSRMMWGNKYAVSETKWYQGHLWAVYEHRLIDNISEPFNNITRKDAFIMLYRLFFSNDVIRN